MSAEITRVTGGVAGIEATYDAIRALADSYDRTGSLLRGWAVLGARVLADPDLAESAVLAPLTFAEAECAVLAATTGPDGVLPQSCRWEADALLVRTAVQLLEAADALVAAAVEELDRTLGRAVGFGLGASAPVLAPVLVVAAPRLSPEARAGAEGWVVGHPGVVEHAVDGGGGLLEGLWDGLSPAVPGGPLGVPLSVPDSGSGAGLLATLYGDDGHAHVVPRPDVHVAGGQPTDVTGLLTHLRDVAALSPAPDSALNGTLEVQTIGAGTGHVRHVVYLPGTDDMATLPWTRDDDVRDFPTDLLLAGGQDNAYQQGILDAMHRAGIGPHEPVLLVGHSMGGMAAAAILGRGSDFDVTSVVTAGSPTAQVDGFPAGSHVLSLEHRGDVVPLLDGEPNPDTVGQTTVTFAEPGGGIVDHHGYPAYLAGAAAVDASSDPSVREQLASLHAQGFLGPGTGPPAAVSSQVFQVTRVP